MENLCGLPGIRGQSLLHNRDLWKIFAAYLGLQDDLCCISRILGQFCYIPGIFLPDQSLLHTRGSWTTFAAYPGFLDNCAAYSGYFYLTNLCCIPGILGQPSLHTRGLWTIFTFWKIFVAFPGFLDNLWCKPEITEKSVKLIRGSRALRYKPRIPEQSLLQIKDFPRQS